MMGWEEQLLRQIQAEHFSIEKQQRLTDIRALVIGLGGVGSAAALYLALAGVQNIGLCDHGLVEESNLHRQILYGADELGLRKVDIAAEQLLRRNPLLRPVSYLMDVEQGLLDFQDPYDLVLDCLDNSPARLAVAAYAHRQRIPVISAGAQDWGGFIALFHSVDTACFSCLYGISAREAPYDPPGIVGPAAGTIGTWQAARAIRLIIDQVIPAPAEYTTIDLWSQQLHTLKILKRPDCPVCSC